MFDQLLGDVAIENRLYRKVIRAIDDVPAMQALNALGRIMMVLQEQVKAEHHAERQRQVAANPRLGGDGATVPNAEEVSQ